jgi:hypothetical protein
MGEEVTKIEIVNDHRSGLTLAGLILGIIAVGGCWIIGNYYSVVLGSVGLVVATSALIIYLKTRKGVLISNILAMVLCVTAVTVGICVNAYNNNYINDNTESILANDIDITFGAYTTETVNGAEKGELTLTVKNKTEKEYSYSLTIEALDEDGIRVGVDTIYIRDVASGQTVMERAFTESNVNALKSAASFRVTKAIRYNY